MPPVKVHCTLGNIQCVRCSNEIYHNNKKASDIRTHTVIKIDKSIPLGLYCNNACTWVSQLTVCPIPEALQVCKDAITEHNAKRELLWMKRKG